MDHQTIADDNEKDKAKGCERMSMNEFLQEDYVVVEGNLTTQKEAFLQIAKIAFESGVTTSAEETTAGLFEREEQSTTGFLDGFAIPHTQREVIQKPAVIIISNQNGIEWNALDGKPVTFMIGLLIPKNEEGTTHLELLSSISRMLIEEEVREKLLDAKTKEDIISIITKALS